MHRASRTLKTLADRWSTAEPAVEHVRNPYAGCEDLDETAAIQGDGACSSKAAASHPSSPA